MKTRYENMVHMAKYNDTPEQSFINPNYVAALEEYIDKLETSLDFLDTHCDVLVETTDKQKRVLFQTLGHISNLTQEALKEFVNG